MDKMRAVFGRLFSIRPGEWRRLILLYMFVFAVNTSVVWGQAAGDSLFLQRFGVQYLPFMFIADALFTIIAIIIYGAFIDRISNKRIMVSICLLGGLALLFACAGMIYDLNFVYPILYILQCILKALISIHAWTYISDFYDTRAARRHFPLISSGSRTSGILAGVLIIPMVHFLSAKYLVPAWIAALIAASFLAWLVPRMVKDSAPGPERTKKQEDKKKNNQKGLDFITKSGFLKLMAVASVVCTMLLYLLEYQSQKIFTERFTSAEELASFYGILGAASEFITLPIQMFFLSPIIKRLGVANANLIFPGLSAISYGLLAFIPSIFSASFARVNRTALRSAFLTPINGLLFNAAPVEIKGRARAFINGMLIPLGAIFAGLLVLSARQGKLSMALLSGVGLIIALTYLIVSIYLRREYSRSLISMLEQEDFSSLLQQGNSIFSMADPSTLKKLQNKLEKQDANPEMVKFMAELICQVGGDEAVPILGGFARKHSDARIRAEIVDALVAADFRESRARLLYADFLTDPDPNVLESAFSGLELSSSPHDKEFQSLCIEMLGDFEFDMQIRILSSLARAGNFHDHAPARDLLSQCLKSDDSRTRARGVHLLGIIAGDDEVRSLAKYLEESDDSVRLEALLAFENLPRDSIPPDLLEKVTDDISSLVKDPVERIRQGAVLFLGRVGKANGDYYLPIVEALSDKSNPVRETAVDTLAKIGKPVIAILKIRLHSPVPQLRKTASVVLTRIDAREFGHLVKSHIMENLCSVYGNIGLTEVLAPWENTPGMAILLSSLREENERLIDEVFYMLGTMHGPEAIKVIRESMANGNRHVFANAVEALESMADSGISRLISPLFEPELPKKSLLSLGRAEWDLSHTDPKESISKLISGNDNPWLRSLAVFALGEMESVVSPEERLMITGTSDLWEIKKNGKQLSIIERIIFLKKVSFFQAMTVEQLKWLADVCEEEYFDKNTRIYNKGAPGGVMYVVVAGRVAIEQEKRKGSFARLKSLEANSYFGEISLFDQSPRSNSAVTIKDSHLLKLQREPLIDLMGHHPELSLELINVLSVRLRESSDRVVQLTRTRPNELNKLFDQFN